MMWSSLQIPCSRPTKTASYEYIQDRQNNDSATKNEKFDELAQWPNGRTRKRIWLCTAHQWPFPYDTWSVCPCTSTIAPPSPPAPQGWACHRDATGTIIHGVEQGGAARGQQACCAAVRYPPTSGHCKFGGGEQLAHGVNHTGVVSLIDG